MALYTKRVAPGTYIEHFVAEQVPVEKQAMELVIGVQGISRRGSLEKPMLLTRNTYKQILGTYITASNPISVNGANITSDLMYELDQYFDNAPAGSDIWVKRIFSQDDPPSLASYTFNDGATVPVDVLKVSAKNEGSWGNHLEVTITNTERVSATEDQNAADTNLMGQNYIDLTNTSSAMYFREGDRIKIHHGTPQYYDVRSIDTTNNRIYIYGTLQSAIGSETLITTTEFNLYVKDTDIDGIGEDEFFASCNLNKYGNKYVESVINDANYPSVLGSNLIKVEVLLTVTHTTLNPTDTATPTKLAGGDDGVGSDIATTDWTTYAAHWDGYKINVLANLGYDLHCTDDTVIKAALNYATDERYWLGAIVCCQPSSMASKDNDLVSAKATRDWRLATLGVDNPKAKMYDFYYDMPETFMKIGNNPMIKMSPLGATLGIYKRFSKLIGLHTAPAGVSQTTGEVDAEIKNAVELYYPIDQEAYQSIVYPYGINSARNVGGKIAIFGSRSLTRDKRWLQVNFSMYMSVIEVAIQNYFAWVPFKSDSPDTYAKVAEQGNYFFQPLAKYYKKDAYNPSGYYFKVLNLDPEKSAEIDKGYIVAEFGVSLYDAAEYFVIRTTLLTANTSGTAA